MGPYAGPGHAINKQAQLASAYQELGKELGSEKLKVVGGYTIGRVIGEGSFGAVHLATHRLTGSRCAIKKIPKTLSSQITREIHHHRRLHHLHIVQLYEIIATETHIWLVTELCSGGELFDYLVERGRMLEGEARRLFGELAVAVGHMHNEGIVHRDLKLENVLLDGELRVKLADMGFAREWSRGKLMETHCGTTGYASPEMLSGKKYLGIETDVWSLGIILYILLCGGLPFDDDDERVMKDMIVKGEYEEPDWLSEEARSLIRSLLSLNPAERPSIEDIFAHPWFQMTIVDAMPASMPTSPNPPTHSSDSWKHTASPLASPLDQDMLGTETVKRVHSGEFSHTEKALELLHQNNSEATIRDEREVSFSDHIHLPVSARTPSRTKRRSVSSTLSLERRLSHHSITGHAYPQEDYLGMLRTQRPPPFSTPSEKSLLNQLNDLGFDIGQLTHSVENDACDSSSASWWLLRAKQVERGETDEVVAARQASSARKREKLAAYARDERRKARVDDSPDLKPVATVAFKEPYHLAPPITQPIPDMPTITPAPTTPTRESAQLSPESPRDKSGKSRSPSMSMLQRATSALLGKEELDSRSTSPTKLVKYRTLPKSESDSTLLSVPTPVRTDVPNYFAQPAEAGPSKSPTGKSMWTSWTTFRQFFDQAERRKKTTTGKAPPTIVLSRGIAARTPHVNRINRQSVDRPTYSRRSSSVNSRRSSISMQVQMSSDNLPQLGRRASGKSHGSATPTSDREQTTDSRRNSAFTREMRSPSMQSESSSRFPSRQPASPLHNYQRRPPQGTASKRIRHIRVIPETQVLRSSSVASSIKSNHSSRASSVDGRREDSDYDSRDDSSIKHRAESLARQIHRKGSPLVHGSKRVKPKPVLRDVFQGKDDEWEDEEEFAGGYGQGKGAGDGTRWVNGFRAASFPAASGEGKKKRAKAEEDKSSRRGIPVSRGAPMPIAEEEEEEEE